MGTRYYVYILTNHRCSVLYTGVTNDLKRRIGEHRRGEGSQFAARYRAHRLVYYESFDEAYGAIQREKQLKAGSRR